MARHMVYDISGVRVDWLANKNRMVGFMLECVRRADMKILSGPHVLDTGALDPNPGLTGWTVLTTSHVSIHTFLRQGEAFIDLFSCVEYDSALIRQAVEEFYQPEHMEVVEIVRAAMTMLQEESNITPIRR